MTERYIGLNIADEEFYVVDSSALNRNKKWFEEEYSEEDDFEQVIEDEWCQYLYENSMSGFEVISKLNELSEKNRQLKEENYVLQDGLDFYKEENGSLSEEISNLEDENEWLKTQIENISAQSDEFYRGARENANCVGKLEKENEQLKQEKEFLKIINDYYIKLGDDGILFSLHKPADIRSLCYNLNRMQGFSELQCQYNDLEKE